MAAPILVMGAKPLRFSHFEGKWDIKRMDLVNEFANPFFNGELLAETLQIC